MAKWPETLFNLILGFTQFLSRNVPAIRASAGTVGDLVPRLPPNRGATLYVTAPVVGPPSWGKPVKET